MKILFICPQFHGYEEKINRALQEKGHDVYPIFYDEKKAISLPLYMRFVFKLLELILNKAEWLKLLKHKLIYRNCDFFFKSMISNLQDKSYDRLLVVKGFGLQCHHLEKINSNYRVLYQWDLVLNYPLCKAIYSDFNKIYTFDYNEAHLGFGEFLPNFYSGRKLRTKSISYDLFFIGEYSDYRQSVLSSLVGKAAELNLKYCLQLIRTAPYFSFGKPGEFISDLKIPRSEYERKFDLSIIIFEVTNKGQQGSTQRLLEGLEQGKIVCTTDKKACSMSRNVISLDEFLKLDIESYNKLISTRFGKYDPELISKFELDNWLDILLTKV